MEKIELLYRWESDEECSIYLDHRYLMLIEHGRHGWDGMTAVITTLNRTAEMMGWTISIEGDPGV